MLSRGLAKHGTAMEAGTSPKLCVSLKKKEKLFPGCKRICEYKMDANMSRDFHYSNEMFLFSLKRWKEIGAKAAVAAWLVPIALLETAYIGCVSNKEKLDWLIDLSWNSESNCGYERRRREERRIILTTPVFFSVHQNLDTWPSRETARVSNTSTLLASSAGGRTPQPWPQQGNVLPTNPLSPVN